MKSVVTAAWFLNNAFGNLIVVLITELKMFSSQSDEFFFYAVLMVVAIVFYTYLAYDYVLQEHVEIANINESTLELITTDSKPRKDDKDNNEVERNDDTPSTSKKTLVNV